MDVLNPTALKSLVTQQGKWCVSLYMPTHRAGPEQQQDPIRLKNLLAKAEANLLAAGLRKPAVQALLRPAQELLWDTEFWQHQGEGLAIFLTNDFYQAYRLPLVFEEHVSTGTSFHLKPLLPAIGRGMKFYLLALSLNHIRLFEGNAETMSERELDFPTSMQKALWADDPEKHLNLHSGSGRSGEGKGGAGIFHGHDPEEDEKVDILRFFQTVDDGLNTLLEEKSIPMVLAGVEYLLPIFREASSYQNLLEQAVAGSPERVNPKELHAKAWQIVQPILEENQKQAQDKFEQLNGQKSDLAISDLKTAVRAAVFGQVETIFVPLHRQKWGTYDGEKDRVLVQAEAGPENEDLYDFAATQTLMNSGQVFAVQPEHMPGGGEVAAILRYAA